jgi:hypothetical protein
VAAGAPGGAVPSRARRFDSLPRRAFAFRIEDVPAARRTREIPRASFRRPRTRWRDPTRAAPCVVPRSRTHSFERAGTTHRAGRDRRRGPRTRHLAPGAPQLHRAGRPRARPRRGGRARLPLRDERRPRRHHPLPPAARDPRRRRVFRGLRPRRRAGARAARAGGRRGVRAGPARRGAQGRVRPVRRAARSAVRPRVRVGRAGADARAGRGAVGPRGRAGRGLRGARRRGDGREPCGHRRPRRAGRTGRGRARRLQLLLARARTAPPRRRFTEE